MTAPVERVARAAERLDRGLPRHPASERAAAAFHGFCAAVCALHIGLGLLGVWYHTVGWVRHFKEREQ